MGDVMDWSRTCDRVEWVGLKFYWISVIDGPWVSLGFYKGKLNNTTLIGEKNILIWAWTYKVLLIRQQWRLAWDKPKRSTISHMVCPSCLILISSS